jgi:hypothetical protein
MEAHGAQMRARMRVDVVPVAEVEGLSQTAPLATSTRPSSSNDQIASRFQEGRGILHPMPEGEVVLELAALLNHASPYRLVPGLALWMRDTTRYDCLFYYTELS